MAEVLKTTKHVIRRLWRAGLLQGSLTETGRLNVPGSEIARLLKEGIPPLPKEMEPRGEEEPDAFGMESQFSPADDDLSDGTSNTVRCSFDELTIGKNHLQQRRLELDLEDVEDCFRARDLGAIKEQEAKADAERQQRQRAAIARRRQQWERAWQRYAVKYMGRHAFDAPSELKLEIRGRVAEALRNTHFEEPDRVVRALVGAVIERSLKPWRRKQKIEKGVRDAIDSLPAGGRSFHNPTKWQIRAKQEAYRAVQQLSESATPVEIQAVARNAIEPARQEFEHRQACDVLARQTYLNGATQEELEEARMAVKHALLKVAIRASRQELERVKDAALAPLRDVIVLREAQELRLRLIRQTSFSFPWDLPIEKKEKALYAVRQAFEKLPVRTAQRSLEDVRNQTIQPFLAAHEKQKQKNKLIERGMREICPFLLKLEQDWEFDKDTLTLKDELTNPIRSQLEKYLTGEEADEDVTKRVRQLVRRELGLTNRRNFS